MFKTNLYILLVVSAMILAEFTMASDKGDTIIVQGEHGCPPQLMLKTSKKKGDILVMQDCKKKKKKVVYYPVYHHYGGHQDSYGHSYGAYEGYGGGGHY